VRMDPASGVDLTPTSDQKGYTETYTGPKRINAGTPEVTEVVQTGDFEAVLNWVDGRDRTPPERWDRLLFWGKFVGSDRTHKIVRPGCGWAHYPPNGERDYDWANPRYVLTDIEDWRPDGTGQKQRMNCERWKGDSLTWFVYWMQNLPGAGNGLTHEGKALNNWWVFLGDFIGYNSRHVLGGPRGIVIYASIYSLFLGSGLGTLLWHVQLRPNTALHPAAAAEDKTGRG